MNPDSLVVVGAAQHVALTYDAGSGVAALYLDGAQLLATNVGAFVASTTQDLYLGYRPAGGSFAGRRFVGALDEVGLYDRALSGCEIQAIYTADSAGRDGADFSACSPAGGVEVTVRDGIIQGTGSGFDWQTGRLRFTATNATTPLVFRGLPSGVRLDGVVLTEVITNAPLVYTRFTEDRCLKSG